MEFSEADVRAALWDISRAQGALDRAIAERHNWTTWQERTTRAQAVARASDELFALLDKHERSGLSIYMEVMATHAATKEGDQVKKAS
jgi:hypothetical protein